jgi:hypothetical protein
MVSLNTVSPLRGGDKVGVVVGGGNVRGMGWGVGGSVRAWVMGTG